MRRQLEGRELIDFIEKLHAYTREEIINFGEQNNGLQFYSAEHIRLMIYAQEMRIRNLRAQISRIKNAHDKLYSQLDRLRKTLKTE